MPNNHYILNTINVWLLTEYFYPLLSGGAERFKRYAIKLKDKSINYHVFTIKHDKSSDYDEIDGVSVHRINIQNELGTGQAIPSALLVKSVIQKIQRQEINKPNIIHVLTHTLSSVNYLWYERVKFGIPCIHTITMVPDFKRPISLKLKIHQWLRYSPFNLILTSSEVMASTMAEFGISKKRIQIIVNGVDLSRFRPITNLAEKKMIRKHLGLNQEDIILLFVGFISKRKGIDYLLSAWPEIISRCPTAQLVMVGPNIQSENDTRIDSHFIGEAERIAKNSPHPDRIHFINTVPNVEQYMQCSDIFIFPSRQEGMGNVVAEAMACGLPCILTPYIGLPREFGSPGHEYILAKFDQHSIADNVCELINNFGKRKSIGSTAQIWASTKLDVNISVDQYAKMYEKLFTASSR